MHFWIRVQLASIQDIVVYSCNELAQASIGIIPLHQPINRLISHIMRREHGQ